MTRRDTSPVGRRRLLAGWAAATLAGAAFATAARADCSVGGLSDVVNGATIVAAATVPVAGETPAYCDVLGKLATTGEGAGPGMAGFELRLPSSWNGKVLVLGVGGLAGATYDIVSVNPVDLRDALPKGYATAITDEGHQGGNTDASFALLNAAGGRPDLPAQADYAYRATHQVTVAAKRLAAAFYGRPVERAYFDGCSNGGRQAMVEATRYPEDFDGLIAGAPFLDLRLILADVAKVKALLASSDSYLPASALPAIDAKVLAACDAADGVTDGLIQNPAACDVKPSDLGLRPGQTAFLATYLSALRDPQRRLVYPGFAITDLAGGMDVWTVGLTPPSAPASPEPWGNTGFDPAPTGFQIADHVLQDYVARDPGYDYRASAVSAAGVASRAAIQALDAATASADAATPSRWARFITQGRKLIWYHGLSDPAQAPFRDMLLYEAMAQAHGGYAALRGSVRLFMVPDMQHCVRGSGPNVFDTLGALEAWVERGQAPAAIVATHFSGDGSGADRRMPLCPFPAQASYTGGDVTLAASWSCAPNARMLEVGADGALAGLTPAR